MISHVLVHETPLDVDRLVVGQGLGHFRELLEGLVESLRAPEHEPQVEHRRDEGAAVLKRLLEVIDGIIDLCSLEVSIGLWLAGDLLGFRLVG